MTDPNRVPISRAAGLEARAKIDAQLQQESGANGGTTVHGVPPFTVPRPDGTLEASPDINSHGRGALGRMRRRQGEILKSDQDGDGHHTNRQGYRDGQEGDRDERGGRSTSSKDEKLSEAYGSGVSTRRPLLQRARKAFMPVLLGGLFSWYFDAVGVLVYRNDPRIKGNLLTFSLLCLSTMMSIFFYLEFIRPRLLKKPTVYVNWEKEMLYPVRTATISLVVGVIGANIALWPVWHLWTGFVLMAVFMTTLYFLGIFF